MTEQKKIVRNYVEVTIEQLVQLIESIFYDEYYVKFDRFSLILQVQNMFRAFKAINMKFQYYVNILYHNISKQTYHNIEIPEDALGWQLACQHTYYKTFRFCLHKAILKRSEVYYLQEVFEEALSSSLFILNVWYQINMLINLQNKKIQVIDKINNIIMEQNEQYYLILNSISIPPQVSFVLYNITHLQLTCIFDINYSHFNLVNIQYLALKETEIPQFSLMQNLKDLLLTEIYDLDLQRNPIPQNIQKLFINQCEKIDNIVQTLYNLDLNILCLENISLDENIDLHKMYNLIYLQLYNINTQNIQYQDFPKYNGKLCFQIYSQTQLQEITIELTGLELIFQDPCIYNLRRLQLHNSETNISYRILNLSEAVASRIYVQTKSNGKNFKQKQQISRLQALYSHF